MINLTTVNYDLKLFFLYGMMTSLNGYVIAFLAGFMIDKISLFPFILGVATGAIMNGSLNFNLDSTISFLQNQIKKISKNEKIKKIVSEEFLEHLSHKDNG